MAYYFYTETAFHHEGEWDYLIKLINASKEAGAHGVKFQVIIDLDNLTSSKHDLYPKLQSCVFTKEEWQKAFDYCHELNLEVIMMPLDVGAFELIEENDSRVKYLDLHSVSFYDEIILDKIKNSGIPLILGVGGRSTNEIEAKINQFGNQLAVLMVGFQSYPSKLEDIKLGRIQLFKEKYPSLRIGYADHSSYDDDMAIKSNEYAYFLGATYFEKHISVDPGKQRLDYQSALGADKVQTLIENLTYLDQSVLRFTTEELELIEEPELTYRNRQKVVVAKFDLSAGDVITEHNTFLKMTQSGAGEQSLENLIGKKLKIGVERDVAILAEDVQ